MQIAETQWCRTDQFGEIILHLHFTKLTAVQVPWLWEGPEEKKSSLIQRVHPIAGKSKAPQFIHEYDAELRGRLND